MKMLSNILVVEDNADDVFLLKEAFKRAGASSQLNSAQDGLEAQEYLKGEGAFSDRTVHPFPQVLLLDLNMPRQNGFEFLQWLRLESDFRQLMVHVLTASVRNGDAELVYALGANSYVVKPSRLVELVGFVQALHQWHRHTILPPALKVRL